jgi:hypothetical protein
MKCYKNTHKKYFIGLIVLLTSLTALAKPGHDETISYINNILSIPSVTFMELTEELKVVRTYSLQHEFGCTYKIYSKTAWTSKSRGQVNNDGEAIVDFSKVIIVDDYTEIALDAIGKPEKGSPEYIEHEIYTYEPDLPGVQQGGKKAKSLGAVYITNPGKTPFWEYDFHFWLNSKDNTKKLEKAFNNLKETCPKDPFG